MSKHKMLQTSVRQKSMAFDKNRWRIFGNWLKEKREAANLSQDGLADLIGKDRQTIYRIENAISGTKRETVIDLATALKVDESEALTKAGFSSQKSTDILKIEDIGDIQFSAKAKGKLSEEGKKQFEVAVRTAYAIAEKEEDE